MKKDEIIEQRNTRIKELVDRIQKNSNDASHRMTLQSSDFLNAEFEMKQIMEINEIEIADRDYKVERAESEIERRRETAHEEKQLWFDREMSLQNALDELKDKNINLIGINNNLRSRIADQIRARARDDGNSPNRKVIEDLQAELRRANSDLMTLQESVDSNPRLGEALINVEQDEVERWKKCIV